MIDHEELEKILQKIFSSDYFSSKFDRKLLQYLIDATLNSRVLKETDIAKELFQRDEDFNPSDSSIVRSHMYSLRKKLGTYYISEGLEDQIRLSIPKGHYKVEFISKPKPIPQKTNKLKPYYIPAIIIFILLFFVIYFWQESSNLKNDRQTFFIVDTSNIIWSDFLNSKLPTLLVIGDYYVYQKPHEKKEREIFLRNTEINSNKDLELYLRTHPEEKNIISKTSLTYLGSEVPAIVTKLTKVFRGDENKLKIILGSELTWGEIKRNNIIFIGSPKTIGMMHFFIKNLRYKISIFPNRIFYTPNYKDTVETFPLESRYKTGFQDDYSYMAKFQTANKNCIMLIVSFSSFGKAEILNHLVSPTFSRELKEKNFIQNEMPPYFEILFKIHGIGRNGLNTNVIHFDEINSKVFLENNHQ